MAELYARKIKNGEMNPATGETWKLEDVPLLWRGEVSNLLNSEGDTHGN